ncbi:MAG: quinolinate synthase NadA [Armatimonadetes bacterium]|nr:quinolinate synthase NadA [Candidatus Hippobium faecium]
MTEKIKQLAKEQHAVILAHNYTSPDLQEIADYTGDSLELSRIAAKTDAEKIIFCGVHFMAETAKILSPEKTVLIPDRNAGCPMADTITLDELRDFKAKYPGVPVVAYVNTTAEIKSEVDICCTSGNALNVVRNFPADKMLFVPDKNLGSYIQKLVPEKELICWQGSCPVHRKITDTDLINAKRLHPEALAVTHPECEKGVVALSDIVASTSGMIKQIKESSAKEFIICTERGLIHQFRKACPDKIFHNPSPINICPNMKKITMEKLLLCLETGNDEIILSDEIIAKAKTSIERMIEY